MNETNETNRYMIPRESQAGHYVVAAAIILAAVLLILFLPRDHGCCCCCQRAAPVTPSTTTLGQIPVAIPPGAVAPMPAIVRRVAVVPAAVAQPTRPSVPVADVFVPEPAGELAPQEQPGEYVESGMYPPAGWLLPYPPAPRERHKHHEPVVHVPEAGSSLAWMAIGATGIVGLFVMKKPRA